MKQKNIFFSITMVLLTGTVFGQVSGNQITGQSYNRTNRPQTVNKLYLSDTSFIVTANVLINIIADTYVATFGVSESATTLKEANTKIDDRIQNFVTALTTRMEVSKTDIHIDLTTQTQISDYNVNGNYAEQFISGFEQKKNVIIKFKKIQDLDEMLALASDHGIYDLAKVDYLVTEINSVYTQLFRSALEVVNSKKEMYVEATNIKLRASSQIYGESFYSFSPSQLYKSYTPNITAEYRNYNSTGKRKDLKKNTTYYYDHLNYSGFDKILNPVVTEPAVEFVLMLQIKFYIDREGK